MTVPVMTPVLLLILNPAGAPARAKVQGEFGQVEATARLTTAPVVVVCAPGLVIVGVATMVQVKLAVVAVDPSTSVIVTVAAA